MTIPQTKTLSSLLRPVDALPSSFERYWAGSYLQGAIDYAQPIYDPDAKCVWRVVGSGVKTWAQLAPNVAKILKVLEERGVVIRNSSSGSPGGNADAYNIGARFLDGGLAGVTGNYWYEERGVFVWGPNAVNFLAEELGLRITPKSEKHFGGI